MKNETEHLLAILKSKQTFSEYKNNDPFYIDDHTLSDYLFSLLEKKQLEKSEIIRRSNLDRVYGYQIFSGLKTPSRDKVLALALGMDLSLEETQDILRIANHPQLYVKKHRDSIIIFGLHKQLGVLKTNELLFNMGEPIIE